MYVFFKDDNEEMYNVFLSVGVIGVRYVFFLNVRFWVIYNFRDIRGCGCF